MKRLLVIFILPFLLLVIACENQSKIDVKQDKEQELKQDIKVVEKTRIEDLLKRANNGDRLAQFDLGFIYFNLEGDLKDEKQAKEWFEKSAKQGFIEAQYNLGLMYENGAGVEKNWKEAISWYEKAAVQDDMESQFKLGFIYYRGKDEGLQDYSKAKEWFEKSIAQGNQKAKRYLSMMYAQGKGVPKDQTKALELMRTSYSDKDLLNNKSGKE
jgi:TPR repeat protein